MIDLSWNQDLNRELMIKAGVIKINDQRNTCSPWMKARLCAELDKPGVTYKMVSDSYGFPIKTLEKIKAEQHKFNFEKQPHSDLHQKVTIAWEQRTADERRRLDIFVSNFQRRNAFEYGRDQIVQALIDLGLHYPRGPRIKNEGTNKKRYFDPHALWEGDGKTTKIFINGMEFSYCWYALIDQNTTLIVGSSITGSESAQSFLQALKNGKDKVGFMTMGVLIDNRLTHEEKTQVKDFCTEHGIILVNTFPGNSKSNGIIEGNFSIFEKQIGEVRVYGKNPSEIAASIAKNIIEIFTQQRNYHPRKRLNGQTPEDAAKDATRPLHQRSLLELLRDRFLKEEIPLEIKLKIIDDLFKEFEFMNEDSLKKFYGLLKKYSINEIIAAKASFKAQQAKNPEEKYRSEYFLAILRYKSEENSKAAYNEEYRASYQTLIEIKKDLFAKKDLSQIAIEAVAFLSEASGHSSSTHLLMSVESLCWALTDFVTTHQLPQLWEKIVLAAQRSRAISLRKWQLINEFIHERLGMILYPPFKMRKDVGIASLSMM